MMASGDNHLFKQKSAGKRSKFLSPGPQKDKTWILQSLPYSWMIMRPYSGFWLFLVISGYFWLFLVIDKNMAILKSTHRSFLSVPWSTTMNRSVFSHGFLQETHRKPRSGAGRASHACASACLVLGQAKEATWRGDVAGEIPETKHGRFGWENHLQMIRFSIATFDHCQSPKTLGI